MEKYELQNNKDLNDEPKSEKASFWNDYTANKKKELEKGIDQGKKYFFEKFDQPKNFKEQ